MHKNKKSWYFWCLVCNKVQSQPWSYYLQYYRHVGWIPLLHTIVLGAHRYFNYSLNPGKHHISSWFLFEML